MSKCVDFEDVKQCVDLGIARGMTLAKFRVLMEDWTDFVEGRRWRKCDEEMPGHYEVVLVSIEWSEGDYDPYVSLGSYENDTWTCLVNADQKFHPTEKIVAWMPLPAPYKEGAGK